MDSVFKSLGAGLLLIAWMILPPSVAIGQEDESQEDEHEEHHDEVPIKNDITDPLTKTLMDDLWREGQSVGEYTNDPEIGGDLPVPEDARVDSWSFLVVTRPDNPLVSYECRKGAFQRAFEVTDDREFVEPHVNEHLEEWREVQAGTRKIKLSSYLKHMKECDEFCGPYTGLLIKCHVEAVSTRSRELVLFKIGSPRVGEPFRFLERDRNRIVYFARQMKISNKSVVLLGRASILGPGETFATNHALAARRIEAVAEILVEGGLSKDKVLRSVVGWEPPRLNVQEISDAYGFGNIWKIQANPQYMDQSVMLVGYETEAPQE